jgi:hypothetical protein
LNSKSLDSGKQIFQPFTDNARDVAHGRPTPFDFLMTWPWPISHSRPAAICFKLSSKGDRRIDRPAARHHVKAVSMSGLAEEACFAYKNISEVVNQSIVQESPKQWRNYGPSAI